VGAGEQHHSGDVMAFVVASRVRDDRVETGRRERRRRNAGQANRRNITFPSDGLQSKTIRQARSMHEAADASVRHALMTTGGPRPALAQCPL